MTPTSPPTATVPLGVGKIVAESFSLFGKNFIKVVLFGFLGAVLPILFNGLAVALGISSIAGQARVVQTPWVGLAVTVIGLAVSLGLVTALMVQLAYDAKLGRPTRLGAYFGPALRAVLPIAILSAAVFALVFFGSMALNIAGVWVNDAFSFANASAIFDALGVIASIIGTFWVCAVFCVMAPAVVIDRAGLRAWRRSAALTKGYRWPIVGALVVIGTGILVSILVVGFSVSFLIGEVLRPGGGSTAALIGFAAWASFAYAITYGLGGISVSLIYARLREIKEGVGVDDIAKVFE